MPAVRTHYEDLSREDLVRLLNEQSTHPPGFVGLTDHERYRNLIEQAADGIFVSDENGTYLEVNASGAQMLGATPEDIVGHNITEFLPESEHESLRESLIRIRRGEICVHERLFKHRDGFTFPAEVTAKQLSDGRIQGILRDITERKRTDEALRQSEERFRKLTAAAFEGICISENGLILDINDQFAQMFGYPRGELIGLRTVDLVAPKYRPILADRIRHEIGGPLEHQALRRDGTSFEAEAQAKTIAWGGRHLRVTAVRDITDRKRTEEALRVSEQRFRSYFDLTIVGFAVSSPEKRWIEVNDKLCEILGYSRAEMLERSWPDMTHPEDLAVNESAFVQVIAGKSEGYTLSKRYIRKDGRVIDARISTRCIRKQDRTVDYFLTVIEDVTEQRAAELERQKSALREQDARKEFTRQLIASQETERRRIASELHDSLGQNLLLMKNRAHLGLIAKDLAAAAEQLQGISDLASQAIAEVRQISHDLRPYQLDQLGLTRAMTAMIETARRSSSIVFEDRLESVDELFSPDSATQLYRVLQECLTNILKHSGATHAGIELERDVHEVRLTIKDNGRGFDPVRSGQGFGLTNIAERSRMIGGEFRYGSEPGKGTQLTVVIPIPG